MTLRRAQHCGSASDPVGWNIQLARHAGQPQCSVVYSSSWHGALILCYHRCCSIRACRFFRAVGSYLVHHREDRTASGPGIAGLRSLSPLRPHSESPSPATLPPKLLSRSQKLHLRRWMSRRIACQHGRARLLAQLSPNLRGTCTSKKREMYNQHPEDNHIPDSLHYYLGISSHAISCWLRCVLLLRNVVVRGWEACS